MSEQIDKITGKPIDQSYLECDLPKFLQDSIQQMNDTWYKLDNNIEYFDWDWDYCNLQSDINVAEVEQMITSEQAWYLREKYLRIRSDEEL